MRICKNKSKMETQLPHFSDSWSTPALSASNRMVALSSQVIALKDSSNLLKMLDVLENLYKSVKYSKCTKVSNIPSKIKGK
mgnify:FL=1